jgi:hypothetical protein
VTGLAASGGGSATIGALIVVGCVVLYAGSWLRDRRRHPYVPCRKCRGRGRYWSVWTAGAWRPCPRCGGRGSRLRWGVRER